MRASIVVHALIIGLLAPLAGCATATSAPSQDERSDAASQADILYAAILEAFQEQGIEVGLRHEESGVVVSAWNELNSELRRRYVSRVVQSNEGLLLRVVAEFERRDRSGEEPVWVPAEDQLTAQRARREEADLGAEIQTAFKRLSK